jgi:hypothetical protein
VIDSGTFVKGHRALRNQPVPLTDGDGLTFGAPELVVFDQLVIFRWDLCARQPAPIIPPLHITNGTPDLSGTICLSAVRSRCPVCYHNGRRGLAMGPIALPSFSPTKDSLWIRAPLR